MIDIKWIVILISLFYMALLFGIAYLGEKNESSRWVKNPYVYALSLAVYCTAWTFYGSVGRAASAGLDFLTTYIGPILLAPLLWVLVRKVIRISKVQRITTIADFISSRYGKDTSIGALVAFVCFFGVLPYISIQIKAISKSFTVITEGLTVESTSSNIFFNDTAFYITLILACFTILFGARRIDTHRKNSGLVSVIAFESLFKLLVFFVIGVYITFFLFDGFGDVFNKAAKLNDFEYLITIDNDEGYSEWMWLNILSAFAFILLPRQFQVMIKENTDEKHLLKASWLFPLYLLLINIFVVPIAMAGRLIFQDIDIDADMFMLAIPMNAKELGLAIMTYLGGFSAATSMIIVSTTALGVMISNSVINPLILKNNTETKGRLLLRVRQFTILFILLFSYLYFKFVSNRFSIVSIGLISFVAVAQLAPSFIIGLYWKSATRIGAFSGICIGMIIWFFTLVVPTIVSTGWLPESIMTNGLFGIELFKPYQFLGVRGPNSIVNGFFASFFFNLITYLIVSLLTKRSTKEINQAEVFVDIFKYSKFYESAVFWKGKAMVKDVQNLLERFLGRKQSELALNHFQSKNNIDQNITEADFRMVNFAENLLAGAIGSSSARVLVSSVVREEQLHMDEVLSMLKETQHFISDNKELRKKSEELAEAGEKLRIANQQLREIDDQKDEFISTVTHEMRTPVTAIRASSEIMQDPSLTNEERAHFSKTIVEETQRMERLINQVLDLEKMRSGKMNVPVEVIDLNQIAVDSLDSLSPLIQEKGIKLNTRFSEDNLPVLCNEDKIKQVILNLVSNAIKFCNKEDGKIALTTNRSNGTAELSVGDNGSGIPVESRPLLFQAFYQAQNQTIKKPEGSGLGLTISKKIIEYHNGEIWIEQNEPNGAVVAFKIPLMQ
ncbi:MAG: sensor histidine kinase [Bacteroidota bacterium]